MVTAKISRTQTSSSRTGSDGKQTTSKPSPRGRQGSVFHQRLAALTYHQACQMLGDEGARLIRQGARFTDIEPDEDVFLGGDLLRIKLRDRQVEEASDADDVPEFKGSVVTTMTLQSARSRQIQINCDSCDAPCHHLGAALDYLLDAKSVLGLAAPPDESVPLENLTEKELLARALDERLQRAASESMRVKGIDPSTPWTDYVVTSWNSGKSYRVALRGTEPHESYCSCPDFRTNGLGTCKHILHVAAKAKKRFGAAAVCKPHQRKQVSLRLHYGSGREGDEFGLRFNAPDKMNPAVAEIIADLVDASSLDVADIMRRLEALEHTGASPTIYPDAEEFIQRQLTARRLAESCAEVRRDVFNHPLRTQLLKAKLLPYQLDGIAFAVAAGRAILADDMGLGKTIQGIGVAELLAQWAGIQRVLVVCPASLKSQWRDEVHRFSNRSVQLIFGNAAERREQYRSDTYFTVCNYEQVLRDLEPIEAVKWDLIILDEGQRIKNWESKTSNVIRSLASPFRLVLSGTPLENNLGELFTVARFVDEHRLGSAFRFFNRHRVVDERGKTIGYQNLDELRRMMQPILLRRTRAEVARQLPERIDEVVRITPTAEQLEIHDGQMRIVAQIVNKKFFTEMDLLRLRQALATARMSCDSTFLVTQEEPEYSSKLERLHELLEALIDEPSRKIVLFSEWKRMLDRVERRLDQIGCEYVRLDGSVPQKKRPPIVNRFQTDADCRVILMTNAGATGLNLQAANVVINCDLPWNPAVLEQRIARAHRMGQKNPVHIYNLVSTDTIEEQLLDTLASKQQLADASLDIDSEINAVAVASGAEDLRRRLEQLLLHKPAAPVDQSGQRKVEQQTQQLLARRESVSRAAGDLVAAALNLAGNLLSSDSGSAGQPETVEKLARQLSESIETDEAGRPQIRITLADQNALRGLAETLAKLLPS
ncbi:MAG: SNF2-related protein [Planctomycetaceae bacterium]